MDWDSFRQRPQYYDRDGKPLTALQWAKLFEKRDPAYYVVRQTTVADTFWISTVWLGLDHSYVPHEPPLIFETIVSWCNRTADEGLPDLDMERYSTLKEARAGHLRFVRKYRERARQLKAALTDLKTTNGLR